MSSRTGAGAAAGLVGGVVFGLMMQMMTAPTPDGGQMSMIAMVGQIVGSPTVGAAVYGIAWWIIGGLVLMPVLLGMPAFAPLLMPPMRMVAVGSLVGHLIYGMILGGVFIMLRGGAGARQPAIPLT